MEINKTESVDYNPTKIYIFASTDINESTLVYNATSFESASLMLSNQVGEKSVSSWKLWSIL